ncbi:protein phosphatase 2C [Angomonas deanei]|nr:protein phosphatase 2C [Angomonas deanei]|eukprot:EPY42099.1 protein phosphatase 2C [Angomonas deanei]
MVYDLLLVASIILSYCAHYLLVRPLFHLILQEDRKRKPHTDTIMGNKASSVNQHSPFSDDWGLPPEDVPPGERDPNELILQSWAYCRAKPSPTQMYRSDVEERQRRKELAWRKRSSFIELDCGDDSFFIANNYKVIGVSDGIGGWSDYGVNSSLFSNTLMENAKLFAETHREERDPEVILQAAYDKVKRDKKVKAGSATACVATLRKNEEGKHILDVANLGDSGAMVIRNRQQLYRVHEKVHDFNAPFQLSVLPKALQGKAFSDRVQDSIRESTEVQEGDVVVLGTDGFFDNRFNSQIAADAGWIGKTEGSAVEKIPIIGFFLSGFFSDDRVEYVDPYRVAQRLVADSYKMSLEKEAQTPWSNMLRQYGVKDAMGGKVDDITVVLSRVSTRESMSDSSVW